MRIYARTSIDIKITMSHRSIFVNVFGLVLVTVRLLIEIEHMLNLSLRRHGKQF